VDCPSGISVVLILGLLEESLSAYTLMKLLRSYLGIREFQDLISLETTT
jgi:hypothetical protein